MPVGVKHIQLPIIYLRSLLWFTTGFHRWQLPCGHFMYATTACFVVRPSDNKVSRAMFGLITCSPRGCRSESNHFPGSSFASVSESPHIRSSWLLISCHVINIFQVWYAISRKSKSKETLISWTNWRHYLCAVFEHKIVQIPNRSQDWILPVNIRRNFANSAQDGWYSSF